MNGWNTIVSYWGQFGPSFRANLLLALESAEIPNQNQSQPTPSCDVKDLRFGVLTSWGPQIFIVSGELCECQDFSQGSGKWQPPKTTSKPVLLQKLVFMFWKLFFSAMKQTVVYFQKGRDENFENKAFFQQKSLPPQWIYFGLPIRISFGGGHAGAAGGATMEHGTLTCKDDVHKLHKKIMYIQNI